MELGLSSIGLLEPLARIRGAHPAFAAVSITHLLAHPSLAALTPTLAEMLPTAASQGVSA